MEPSDTQKQATGNRQQATTNTVRTPLRMGSDIAQRMIAFASAIIRVARAMPKDPASRHIAMQVIRSSTSCGANYEEARAAESRPDFIHKLGISLKEIRETCYWLALIHEAQLSSLTLDPIAREAIELGSILGASIRTAR